MNQVFKFHLPWRIPISIAFTGMWLPMLFLYYELGIAVFVMVILNLAVCLTGVWYISVVTVSSNGIVINRIYKLKWDDIVEGNKVRFFGLPHIRIRRKKGLPWSMPLYYKGSPDLKTVLRENTPRDNPLREMIDEI